MANAIKLVTYLVIAWFTLFFGGQARVLAWEVSAQELVYELYDPQKGWQEVTADQILSQQTDQIRLSQDPARADQESHLYYRVALADIGWLGWAKMGQAAGGLGIGKAVVDYQLATFQTPPSLDRPALLAWDDLAVSTRFEQLQQDGQVVISRIDVEQGHQLLGEMTLETRGEGALTGLRLALTGLMAEQYELSYRMATAEGWLDWVEAGQWAEHPQGLSMVDYEISLLKAEEVATSPWRDWPITEPNTYPVGQCTWGVKELAPWLPNWLGNAKDWYARAQELGFATGDQAQPGAILVWEGVAGDAYGHVALVVEVLANDHLRVLEANVDGIEEIRDFRGYFNPHQTRSGRVLGYIYPPQ